MNRFFPYAALLALSCAASGALASSALAVEQGCMSCHGSPPRGDAPTFAQLASHYARYRDDPEAATRLADKLRKHHLLGNISAHERVSEQSAQALIQWLIQGAP